VKMIFDELEKCRNDNNVDNFCKLYILLGLSEFLLLNVNGTVATPIFKAEVSVYPTLSIWFVTYI